MKNIVLIGLPGCGKTTIGKILASDFNLDFIDTDLLIEKKEDMKIKNIFEIHGESYFRKLEAGICEKISDFENTVISTGGGIVLNPENIINLKINGMIFFIDRKPENILESLEAEERPLLKDDKNKIFTLDKERNILYKKYADFIIENNFSCEKTIEDIKESLRI